MSSLSASIVIVTGPAGAGKTTVSRAIATYLERSVHLPMDDFASFIVSGGIDPTVPEAAGQHRAVGGAVFAAALQFAHGGYAVVVDGFVFPDVLGELTGWIASNGVPLHYVVLRPDLDTCLGRVRQRDPAHPEDADAFARLHARFRDLGEHERHVVDHAGSPAEIAHRILAECDLGRLLVSPA